MIDALHLMAGLRVAVVEAGTADWVGDDHVRDRLDGMARAWRIVIAAIEDGEYDAPPGRGEG